MHTTETGRRYRALLLSLVMIFLSGTAFAQRQPEDWMEARRIAARAAAFPLRRQV
jgi:hypothetical protein